MPPAVELQKVTKKYGLVTVLRDLNLKVECGETVAVLGPNGSGKTTILRIVAGHMAPTSGTVKVFGLDTLRNQEAVKSSVGLVSHRSFLYDELTVEENLRFYASFISATRHDLEKALEVTDLLKWLGVSVKQLSFGLRKRADIARAILGNPRALVLDELFSGLDNDACQALVEHLKGQEGTTILISAHSLEWVRKVCKRGVALGNGSIVEDGEL